MRKDYLTETPQQYATPSGGELIYKNIKLDKREVQLLFQNSVNLVNPYRKANDILKEAHLLADQFISYNELLDLCNISTTMLAKRGIELSGGERQRVALARLVAVHPKLILLDEPFAAQDPAAKRVMKEMLLNIKNHHSISLICVSHDFQSLKGFTDYLYVMDEGKIIEEGSAEKIFTSPEHRITARLIKAEKYELTEEELLPPKEIRGN